IAADLHAAGRVRANTADGLGFESANFEALSDHKHTTGSENRCTDYLEKQLCPVAKVLHHFLDHDRFLINRLGFKS
ncbi:MAG: hypothetical protein EBU87_12015, partial [Betaproteobacteria bacterium]|nr:hypothetical protein [Betaproteobacteria bacterium]